MNKYQKLVNKCAKNRWLMFTEKDKEKEPYNKMHRILRNAYRGCSFEQLFSMNAWSKKKQEEMKNTIK